MVRLTYSVFLVDVIVSCNSVLCIPLDEAFGFGDDQTC